MNPQEFSCTGAPRPRQRNGRRPAPEPLRGKLLATIRRQPHPRATSPDGPDARIPTVRQKIKAAV